MSSSSVSIFQSLSLIFKPRTSNENIDFKKINKGIEENINNLNEFTENCKILYEKMFLYAESRISRRSKFPSWFNKIISYKPIDYFSSLIFLNAIVENKIPSSFSKWNNNRRKEIQKICETIRENRKDNNNDSECNSLDLFLKELDEILDFAIENPKGTENENNASGHDFEIIKPNNKINDLIQKYETSSESVGIVSSSCNSLIKILKKLIDDNSKVTINELKRFDDSLELANLDKKDVFGKIKENIIEIYELSGHKKKEIEATYDDFNFDNIGITGKYRRWLRCSKEWDILKKCIVKDISNINKIDDMLRNLKITGWVKEKNDKLVGTEDFAEAATSIVGAYATFIRKAFNQIRKSGKKLSKLNMTNPSKFRKSTKMKVISLLLNYIFQRVLEVNYKEINVIYAGTHGVFVEILGSITPGHDNPTKDARYFKLSDLDKEVNVSAFLREDKEKSTQNTEEMSQNELSQEEKIKKTLVNKVRHLSLYKNVKKSKSDQSKSGILEVENQKGIHIHSIRHLIRIEKDVCECLMDLHDNCLVHGDIKEDNIIITKNGARVIDVDGIQFEGLHTGNGEWENRPTGNIAGNLNPLHFGKVYDDQFKDLYAFGAMIKRQIKFFLNKHKNIDPNDSRLQKLKKTADLCIHPTNVKKTHTVQVEYPETRTSYAHVIYKKLQEIK